MISYVIPTLWYSKNIHFTISQFLEIKDSKAELIIIDNNNENYFCNDPRVTVISMKENIYVNPSWNLGVKAAKNSKVCLLNDDIYFDLKRFHNFAINSRINEIASTVTNFRLERHPETKWAIKEIKNKNQRPSSFGQIILFQKKNWLNLPNEMKLYHGDDLIYYYHTLILGKKFYKINGMKIFGDKSTTTQRIKNHNEITDHDFFYYFKEMHKLKLECSCISIECIDEMELKYAFHYEDIESKVKYQKRLLSLLNNFL